MSGSQIVSSAGVCPSGVEAVAGSPIMDSDANRSPKTLIFCTFKLFYSSSVNGTVIRMTNLLAVLISNQGNERSGDAGSTILGLLLPVAAWIVTKSRVAGIAHPD
jgi:hypothetical protein